MMADLKGGNEGGVMPDPLLLFPAEIWENILKNLSDSRDIQNVFKAFPVLEGLVLKNKYWWLLDQVLPHIFLYMTKTEVLSCRRICQRWTQVVDNFLENLPIERAYAHDEGQTVQHWITEPSQPNDYFNPYYRYAQSFIGSTQPQALSMSAFLRGRDAHTEGRNPIVGRSVHFSDTGIGESLSVRRDMRLEYGEGLLRRSAGFWDTAVECIRSLGGHIWFLTLSFEFLVDLARIQSVVIDSLHSLPNLKLLKIECLTHDSQPDSDDRYDAEWLERYLGTLPQEPQSQLETLPQLPHLESLEFDYESEYRHGLPQDMVNLLITNYSSQIRKLQIFYGFWRKEFCKLFPKLTEVIFFACNDKQTATDLLLSLDAPALHSLRLEYGGCVGVVDVDDVISCLGRFQRLSTLTLNLDFDPIVARGESREALAVPPLHSGHITISSLKSFQVVCYMDSDMSFDFLQRFPSLQYLKISVVRGNEKLHGKSVQFPNLFELLPKLKKIILQPPNVAYRGGSLFVFTKTQYEVGKRNWGLVEPSPSQCVLDALRASCFPWNDGGQPQDFSKAGSQARIYPNLYNDDSSDNELGHPDLDADIDIEEEEDEDADEDMEDDEDN